MKHLAWISSRTLLVSAALAVTLFSVSQAASSTSPEAVTPIDAAVLAEASRRSAVSGHAALSAIRGARFAILNGQPSKARDLLDSAKAFLDLAAREAPTYSITTKTIVHGIAVGAKTESQDPDRVLVDRRMLYVDNFLSSTDRMAYVEKANMFFEKGMSAKALAELNEARVQFVRYWLPLSATVERLEKARLFVGQDKYYEAVAVLRAIEDSVTSYSGPLPPRTSIATS